GSVGWAIIGGGQYRVGGWGLALSDEGSGAWLGREAMRRVLWAYDGRIAWTGLLTRLFEEFNRDPHAIVRWAATANPADFGRLAPVVVEHSARDDRSAIELVRQAAQQIDSLAMRLVSLGAEQIALVGGLAPFLEPRLARETRLHLAAPNIATVYGQKLRLDGQLFLAISQSGRSDDLVETAAMARRAGALTAGLVNATDSPLAAACDIVLPIGAGPELSVAATKSFVA